MLSRARLVLGCHCPVRGEVLFPSYWIRGPQVCFLGVFLICMREKLKLEHSHREESHRAFLLWSCSPVGMLCCMSSQIALLLALLWAPP